MSVCTSDASTSLLASNYIDNIKCDSVAHCLGAPFCCSVPLPRGRKGLQLSRFGASKANVYAN